MTIGRLRRVPLREVWLNEAYDFTPWLQDNLDVLSDELGLQLVSAEREQRAGTFSLDLLAEDISGAPVIIENQLERSDHDHLGKVLTYLVAFDASTAIWIVSEPRPEHVAAIQWLNESSSGSFYLVKVEAVQIGDSAPAPLLTEIVGPSEEAREIGETKREFSERHQIRYDFWEGLLNYAQHQTDLHANISPSKDSWVATGGGITGLVFSYVIRQHDGRVELYIDRGIAEENKFIFDQFISHQGQIETAFGEALHWQRLETKRACRISYTVETGGYRDDNWQAIYRDMVDAMIRLEAALRPYINQLDV